MKPPSPFPEDIISGDLLNETISVRCDFREILVHLEAEITQVDAECFDQMKTLILECHEHLKNLEKAKFWLWCLHQKEQAA